MILKESGSAPGVGPIHKDEIQATLAPQTYANVTIIDKIA